MGNHGVRVRNYNASVGNYNASVGGLLVLVSSSVQVPSPPGRCDSTGSNKGSSEGFVALLQALEAQQDDDDHVQTSGR